MWIVRKLLTFVRPGINVDYKSSLRYQNGTWKIWISRLFILVTFVQSLLFFSTLILISRIVSIGKFRIVLTCKNLTEGLLSAESNLNTVTEQSRETYVRACISSIARSSELPGDSAMWTWRDSFLSSFLVETIAAWYKPWTCLHAIHFAFCFPQGSPANLS